MQTCTDITKGLRFALYMRRLLHHFNGLGGWNYNLVVHQNRLSRPMGQDPRVEFIIWDQVRVALAGWQLELNTGPGLAAFIGHLVRAPDYEGTKIIVPTLCCKVLISYSFHVDVS